VDNSHQDTAPGADTLSAELSLSEVWARVLASLEAELLKPSFETWLRDSRPVGYFDDTVVIGLKNAFALEWVQSKYLPLIRAILHGILGREVGVKLVVLPAGSSPGTEDVPVVGAASAPAESVDPPPDERRVASTSEAHITPGPPSRSSATSGPGSTWPSPVTPSLRRGPLTLLNPKYTFESFVVGNSNHFAHAGALAVADAPARAYNPLFIYGGVGLGKTHLMQAIGHQVARKFPDMAILYVTAETFTNELINAIRDDRTPEFKNRYRSIDLLLIDDIQFIAGKERTQEEFFHTFEALHGASRQIVISSDRPPKEIPTLEERLRSRFEWGLLADIQPPDLETRVAILRKKAQQEGLPVPDDVLMYIATRIDSNIRELEGALIRIVATASLRNTLVTLDVAAEALRDILPPRSARSLTLADVQKAVCRYFSLSLEDLKGESRARKVALPRQLAMYLCRELTGASLPRIGEEFGGRDHTTVLHACDKIDTERQRDPDIENAIRALLAELRVQLR